MTSITFTFEDWTDAQAVVDAINCFTFAAEGNTAALAGYQPQTGPEQGPANAWIAAQADQAEMVAAKLRELIATARDSDPEVKATRAALTSLRARAEG